MITDSEWRYNKICCLTGETFRFAAYSAPSEDWDHDHCSGCWAKFADFDDALHAGYVCSIAYEETPVPPFIEQCREQGMLCVSQPAVEGYELHWVCPACFEDFRVLLQFKLDGQG